MWQVVFLCYFVSYHLLSKFPEPLSAYGGELHRVVGFRLLSSASIPLRARVSFVFGALGFPSEAHALCTTFAENS